MKKKPLNKYNYKKSLTTNIIRFKFRRFAQYEIDNIKIIQRCWRRHYFLVVLNKILYIQKIIKGWYVRKLINSITSEIKKLEKFCTIIKITVLYHAIHFNYHKAKRNEYNKNHRFTNLFLKLQRNIKRFLIAQRIKKILKTNDLSNLYIFIQKILLINKNNLNKNQVFIKKIKPISKILTLQKNIRYFLIHKPRKLINKSSFNKNYFFNKIIKAHLIKRKVHSHFYKEKEGLNLIVQNELCFFTKSIIVLKPLLFIQKTYKQRFKYLKENDIINKKLIILKQGLNKHSYFTRLSKKNYYPKLKLLQQEIRYFIYRINSNINLIPKVFLDKCSFTKSISIGKQKIKEHFYKKFMLKYNKTLITHIRKYILNHFRKLFFKNKIRNKTRIEKNPKDNKIMLLKESQNIISLKTEDKLMLSPKRKKVTFIEKPKFSLSLSRKISEDSIMKKFSISPKKSSIKPMTTVSFLLSENQQLNTSQNSGKHERKRRRSVSTKVQILKYKK